jgi:hypothetical protein
VASQKRKNYRDSGLRELSVNKEFPDASYRCPAAGQMLRITDQPDKLRVVLSHTVRQVIWHAISKSTYIEMTKTHSILCKIFMQTACSLHQDVFADRIKADVIFQKDVAGMVCCDLFLNSRCSYYYYLAEQPPVRLSKQCQECSYCRNGQGLVPY